MNVTLKKDKNRGQEIAFIVFDGDRFIGLITKFKETKSTFNHPWKALGTFAGNKPNKFLGAFYPADGGKDAALAAVIANNGASE